MKRLLFLSFLSAMNVVFAENAASQGPDLTVGNVTFTYNAGIIHFTSFEIQNIGTADAADTEANIHLEDNSANGLDVTFSIGALAAGATYSQLPADIDVSGAPSGTYSMEVTADYNSAVAESNESNNMKLVTDNISVTSTTGVLASQAANGSLLKISNSTIDIEVANAGPVSLVIYDMRGNMVAEYVNGILSNGVHSFVSNFNALQTGTYICRFISTEQNISRKFALAN